MQGSNSSYTLAFSLSHLLSAVLLLLNNYTASAANELYHIKPSTNVSCSENVCLTLSQFVAQSESYLGWNTTLIFRPGNHSLSTKLNISAVSSLTMFSNSTLSNPTIVCEPHASITFSDVATVHINNLKFFACSGHKIIMVNWFTLINTSFLNHSKSAIEVVSSEVNFTHCSFLSNTGGTNINYSIRDKNVSVLAGAAILSKWSSINISKCVFEGNAAEVGGAIYAELHSKILIINSIFQQNYVHPIRYCSEGCIGGVLYSRNSTIKVHNSSFYANGIKEVELRPKGGVFGLFDSKLFAEYCIFTTNGPTSFGGDGGVVYAKNAIVFISKSEFKNNGKTLFGGVFAISYTTFIIIETKFVKNKGECGGVMFSESSDITISDSQFKDNFISNTDRTGGSSVHPSLPNSFNVCMKFKSYGGVILATDTNLTITGSNFSSNQAKNGGVLYILSGVTAVITATQFSSNLAEQDGGSIHIHIVHGNSSISIHNANFVGNQAERGAIIYADGKNLIRIYDSIAKNNVAQQGIMHLFRSTGLLSHNKMEDNEGSFVAYFSNITCEDSLLKNFSPHPNSSKSLELQQGGAITAFQSTVILKGCSLHSNRAIEGGAIHATESKVNIYGTTIIVNNRASTSGGGIYLYQSELNCHGSSILGLKNNWADKKGGGVHAIGSILSVEISTKRSPATLVFIENNATYGGGVFLEMNSKLYALVTVHNPHATRIYPIHPMIFQANSADYGGAVYVADETNSRICASESYKVVSTTECFMQLLSKHSDDTDAGAVFITFRENNAHISGSDLFGGLLDRCTVSPFAALYSKFHPYYIPDLYGVTYFYGITQFVHVTHSSMTISSHPVRVCFCNEIEQADCGYHPPPVQVKRGENFKLTIVAVDQINQTISNVTIRSFLLSSRGGLGENQLNQSTGEACTNLSFSVTSPRESEQLVLYADGPCKDAHLSRKTVIVNFTSCDCPVGFQQNCAKNTTCECECNSFLHPYVTKCDCKAGTILRESNFWIGYIDGYLIHPRCPFDYCKGSKEKVEINLGVQNGADAQCDNNRAGILCGTCAANYSLSLGSSRCISCPTHWPAMLVSLLLFSLLAGVLLIALILTLNLTVAVGTLNGIIFYSNVVAANTNIVFPSNPIIAWLNLEPGFDICLFEGMNAYWKTCMATISISCICNYPCCHGNHNR